MLTVNNECICANTEHIILSIFNSNIIMSDIQKEIITYIRHIYLMKKILLNINNVWNAKDLQQNFISYFAWANNIQNKLSVNDDTFNNLLTKHKCIFAPIFKNDPSVFNKAIIYVPDLFITKRSDFVNDSVNLKNTNSENQKKFVLANPTHDGARYFSKEIYNECYHPVLNLLLLNNYSHYKIIEYEDFFALYCDKKLSIPYSRFGQRNRKQITLITSKKKMLTIVNHYLKSLLDI